MVVGPPEDASIPASGKTQLKRKYVHKPTPSPAPGRVQRTLSFLCFFSWGQLRDGMPHPHLTVTLLSHAPPPPRPRKGQRAGHSTEGNILALKRHQTCLQDLDLLLGRRLPLQIDAMGIAVDEHPMAERRVNWVQRRENCPKIVEQN